VARAEAVITETDEAIRQRKQLRLGSGLVALLLVGAAIVMVVRRPGEPHTAKTFCPRIEAAKNLNAVLASGDADQIRAAVALLDRAAKVAPVAIEAQVDIMVRYADGLAQAVRGASDPEAALAAAVRRQEDQIPKVEALDQSGPDSPTTSLVSGPSNTG
jgi:hypothetical protein